MQALAACLITHEVDEVPAEYQEDLSVSRSRSKWSWSMRELSLRHP